MAFVEKRGEWYRVVFRHEGRRYTQTLKTTESGVAEGILGGVRKTLMLLKQRVLHIPEGADVLEFVLNGGQVQESPRRPAEAAAVGDETVLRGWHVLRHSFASNAAMKGVDQRIINSWLGHQTEEMVQRYRHLFPDQERHAINLVFAGAGKSQAC